MHKSWKKIASVIMLVVLFALGGFTVLANPELAPGSPLAPEDWSTGIYDEETPARVHTLRLVVGQYAYTQDGAYQLAEAAPFIINGRTMVPLHLIERTMGVTITQNATAQVFVITQSETVFALQMNQPLPNDMGTPLMHHGEPFVPLRFVAETLGADVRWERTTRSIYIEWAWQPPVGGIPLVIEGE